MMSAPSIQKGSPAYANPDLKPVEVFTRDVGGVEYTWAECSPFAPRYGKPAVVLVHGSLSDYRYWAPQMAALGATRQVIAPSLHHHFPQHWDERRDNVLTYRPEHQADELVTLLRAIGIGPVHLVGHSRGAAVVLLAALRHTGEVRSLVLADPAIAVEDRPGPERLHTGKALPAVKSDPRNHAAEMIAAGDIDGGLAIFIDTVSGPGTWDKLNTRRKKMVRDNATTLVPQIAQAGLSIKACELARLRQPALLIGGEHSPEPYPVNRDALAAELADSTTLTIASASHAMNAENPAGFNEAVLTFIARFD